MQEQNPFYDRMNKLSDEELLKVLSLKDEYNPDAVKAAEKVFNERGLSKDVVEGINKHIEDENFKQEEKIRKRREKVNQAFSIVSIFSNGMSTEFDKNQIKGFKLLIIGLSIYYLYGLYGAFPFLEYVFVIEELAQISLLLETCISLIVFPIGIFLLARLKKEGWLILFFILMSKLIMITGITLVGIYLQIDLWLNPKPPSMFDGLGQQTNWLSNILMVLTLVGVVWYFLKSSVMRLAKVDPLQKRFYISRAIIVSIIYIAVFFLLIGIL